MLIKPQMLRKSFLIFLSIYINNQRAYDTLGDASKRKSYDDFGLSGDQQAQYNDYYKNSGGFGGSKQLYNK